VVDAIVAAAAVVVTVVVAVSVSVAAAVVADDTGRLDPLKIGSSFAARQAGEVVVEDALLELVELEEEEPADEALLDEDRRERALSVFETTSKDVGLVVKRYDRGGARWALGLGREEQEVGPNIRIHCARQTQSSVSTI